jgi:hypothetical protein
MDIYTTPLGTCLKVHSFNSTNPMERPKANPRALIVLCHGFYLGRTETIEVPHNLPELRFAVEHTQAHATSHKEWTELLTHDLATGLGWEYRLVVRPGERITNYFLGKREPKQGELGTNPGTWTQYQADAKVEKNPKYIQDNIQANAVVSSGFAQNIMRTPGSKRTYDFATVTQNCHNLRDLFINFPTAPARANYDYLLLAFCRERIEPLGSAKSMEVYGSQEARMDMIRALDADGAPRKPLPVLPARGNVAGDRGPPNKPLPPDPIPRAGGVPRKIGK